MCNGKTMNAFTPCCTFRPSDRYQLLQCQMGNSGDGHFHGHQDSGAIAHCGHGLLVALQRKYRLFRGTIQWITTIGWLHCSGLLQWALLLFWLELSEFCDGRIEGSIQVRQPVRRKMIYLRNLFDKSYCRNLPRAICISMPVVTVIYVVTNVAYFAVLSPDEILSSDAVAVSAAKLSCIWEIFISVYFQLQVTFAQKMLGMFAWVMPLFVACSTFGSLNGAIFASSRLFFVGARNGHLPAAISLININCLTPIPSLIFMCILTLILLFIRDVYILINYVSYVEALFTLCSVSGLLWLRRIQPDATRPIKVNLIIPLVYLLTCSFLVISSCYVSPLEVGVGTTIILTGIPIYYCTIHRPIPAFTRTSESLNVMCAKLFLCVPNQEKFD